MVNFSVVKWSIHSNKRITVNPHPIQIKCTSLFNEFTEQLFRDADSLNYYQREEGRREQHIIKWIHIHSIIMKNIETLGAKCKCKAIERTGSSAIGYCCNRHKNGTGPSWPLAIRREFNIFDLFFLGGYFFFGSLSVTQYTSFFLYLVQCAILRLHKIHKEMWMSCERDYAKEALDKSLRWLQCWFHICWSDVKIFFSASYHRWNR